jgi:secondary thiamine-phosphate synthase enzyme
MRRLSTAVCFTTKNSALQTECPQGWAQKLRGEQDRDAARRAAESALERTWPPRARVAVVVKVHQGKVGVATSGRGLYDVTSQIAVVVRASGIRTGLCTVFLRHTSASLVVQENADPAVLRDLERWLTALAPESAAYEHDDEGPDDMPAHLRSAVTRSSESIPVTDGALALGTWQALYVWEHRRAPHERQLIVHIAGE